MQRRRGRTSLLAGDLQAAGDIFSTGARVAGIYGYPRLGNSGIGNPTRIGALY
jgi:hypothetical protein